MLVALGLPLVASAPTAARADESTDGLVRFNFTPGQSEARFVMQIRTLGQPPKPAACTTRDLTGQLVLTPDGAVVAEQSQVTVNQQSLRCAAPLRDDMTRQILQTDQYPTSTFAPNAVPGLSVPLAAGSQNFQMVGNQTVRGVSQPGIYESTGTVTDGAYEGTSRSMLKLSDFGISPPKLGPLLSVADEMVAEIDIKATVTTPAP
jgi:polyisoprenoid-binding protein YceI